MKKILLSSCLFAAGMLLLLAACRKDPDTSLASASYRFNVPDGWPTAVYTFTDNALTQQGFELGRKLFYDPRLSRDNTISCGSCHQSFGAFANTDHSVSHGVDNLLGTRNSPSLFNLAWHPSFFWDGGVNHLELQPLNPIQNPVEMDLKIDSVISRVGIDADYKNRFRLAFGDEQVNSQRIFRALSQFMALMISDNSKYDHFIRHEPGGDFSASEVAGLQVFQDNCASCHKPPLFTDFSYRNNGLLPSVVNDSGRGRITRDAVDMYKFKVPSLRNLKFTAPYMHDGRFKTLDEVMDHYDKSITSSATLDPLLKSGIHLNSQQRQDLTAFLGTLNDTVFVHDTRFLQTK